jgi:DNA-binding NtrC family response regulator
VDLRIIAATNRNLKKLVEEGRFREDLYYRLHVVTITVPPLRERAADVPLLVRHFLEKYARAAERPVPVVSPEAMALLASYAWPGNVRELEHALERAVALGPPPLLLPDDLPADVRGADRNPAAPKSPLTLEEMKRWYVAKIVDDCGGNKVRAAEVLGIDRRTLYRILEREAEEDPSP